MGSCPTILRRVYSLIKIIIVINASGGVLAPLRLRESGFEAGLLAYVVALAVLVPQWPQIGQSLRNVEHAAQLTETLACQT